MSQTAPPAAQAASAASARCGVVVTGLGAVTPLGGDVATTWASLLAGRSGVAALPEEWAAGLAVRTAARAAIDPAARFSRVQARRLDRATQFALLAFREAWADAGFDSPAGVGTAPAGDRVGVAIGSGLGAASALLDGGGDRPGGRLSVPMLMVNSPAAQVSLAIGARAGVSAPATACAAGADAIATGLDMIRAGRADVVAVGGTEAMIHPVALSAFARIGALSRSAGPEASRPFDVRRDGFVMGEGAAVLVLESARHARARGARVYCEVAGAGLASDAYHPARPDPSGRALADALRNALADAGLGSGNVAHINAHATSTPVGDPVESLAICSVVGPWACPVSGIKSMLGHLIGAAGAVSAVASVLALHHRVAPPTINCVDLDPAVELDVVRTARPLPDGPAAALSNSAGFGGQNVVLAFRTI